MAEKVTNLSELKDALYEDFNDARRRVSELKQYGSYQSGSPSSQIVAQLAGKIIDVERELREASEGGMKVLDKGRQHADAPRA